ncbi:MAG: hypothetical protein K8R21_11545 [Leptospira sp.]|nr:hypothetical protein [Leptospira sp.]
MNQKIKFVTVVFPISLLLIGNCLYTSIANRFETGFPLNKSGKIRLIFLIKGNACVEICNLKDRSPICKDRSENSCKKLAFGWYPIEFARDETHFVTSDSYPKKKINFIRNLSPFLLSKYGEEIHPKLNYIPVQSIEEIANAYPKGKYFNALVIKIKDFGRDTHWSGIVSIATLLFIHGFYEEYLDMEINFFDPEGKLTKIDSNLPYLRHWTGWVFLLWGPIASIKERDLISDSIETLVGK